MVSTHFAKYAGQIGSFPQLDMNIKKKWNHHLDLLHPSFYVHNFEAATLISILAPSFVVEIRTSVLAPLSPYQYAWQKFGFSSVDKGSSSDEVSAPNRQSRHPWRVGINQRFEEGKPGKKRNNDNGKIAIWRCIKTGDYPSTILSLLEGTSNRGKKHLLT